jgi:hypothetical protein
MAISNTSISPLLKEGDNITLTQSGQVTTISAVTFATAIDLTSGQIKFPVGQVASSDANTLDDYEENTWTPTLSSTGSTFNYATNGQIGTYTKIGRMVCLHFRIQLATTGNTLIASNLSITGIPSALTSGSGTNRTFYSSIYWANFTTSVINVLVELPPSSTSMTVYRLTAAATSPTNLLANSLNATGGSVLGGQITYFV